MAFFSQFCKAIPASHTVLRTKAEPFKDRYVIVSQKDVEDLRRQLDDLCAAGIICPYEEVRPAPKGVTINMMYKMSYDYQWFTERSIPDLYDDSSIETMLNCMVGHRIYTVMGLLSNQSQVPMYPGERKQPYSIRPAAFYETERLQPGYSEMLTNYQTMVGYILRDVNMKELVVFLDYIVIFASTYEEHEERVVRILDKLQKGGIKIALDKSIFCSGEFVYAGHMVLDKGILIAPEKVDTLLDWPVPRTRLELENFLEFCEYYRHFYPGYYTAAEPLYRLLRSVTDKGPEEVAQEDASQEAPRELQQEAPRELQQEAPKELQQEAPKELQQEAPKESTEVPKKPWWIRESLDGKWTEECTDAFKGLKKALPRCPMLEKVDLTSGRR